MEDIEITSLSVAERKSALELLALGFTPQGSAAQVRLSDLATTVIPPDHIDFPSDTFLASLTFYADTSEVYVNGLRNILGIDYHEITDGIVSKGFVMPGIAPGDAIVLKAVPIIL